MKTTHSTCTTPLRELHNFQNDTSHISLRTSEGNRHTDESIVKDQSKFLRELNVENMKLTEEIIKQNLDQTSSIEKISHDRSKLFLLLSEQKVHNKKLAEQNQNLLVQLNSHEKPQTHTSRNLFQSHQYSDQYNPSIRNDYRQDSFSRPQYSNINLLLGGIDSTTRSPQHSRYSSPINSCDRSHSLLPSYSQRGSQYLSHNDLSLAGSRNLGGDSGSHGYDTYRLSDITLLQNHITLVEKENELLKRELTSIKQQESHSSLSFRELQLEVRDLCNAKNTLLKENEDLRNFLKDRTEEANKTITKLAEANQELTSKSQLYQIAVDKLSAELYNMCKSGEKARPTTGSTAMRNSNKENCSSAVENSEGKFGSCDSKREDQNREEIIIYRRENFKLKADLKALSERIETLRKENDQLTEERAREKENSQLGSQFWELGAEWSTPGPQSSKHNRNTSRDFNQQVIFSNNVNTFRSPDITTRDIMNSSLARSEIADNYSTNMNSLHMGGSQ